MGAQKAHNLVQDQDVQIYTMIEYNVCCKGSQRRNAKGAKRKKGHALLATEVMINELVFGG